MPARTPLTTTGDAAERLGVDRTTVMRWAREGRIKYAQKLPGKLGAYLFTDAQIEDARHLTRPKEDSTP